MYDVEILMKINVQLFLIIFGIPDHISMFCDNALLDKALCCFSREFNNQFDNLYPVYHISWKHFHMTSAQHIYIYIYIYKRLKKLPTYEPTGCRIGNKC